MVSWRRLETIELSDCEYESLLELLRYMYSDEVNLSGSNVMEVLYLAKKYMVPSLAEKCTGYLQSNLNVSNVFNILPTAERYEEKELVERCWKLIDKQTEAAVKSDGFATIERSFLEAVVVRDTLKIKEVDLFKAVDLWATQQCQKQRLVVSGKLKRKILGEKVCKAIRFPVMKEKEFATVVLDANILSRDEIILLVKFFNGTLSSPMGFSATCRSVSSIARCNRFQSVLSGWGYGRRKDFLNFSVDKDIMLHGLSLFGSENNNYSVTLEVKDSSNNSTVASKRGTFSSKRMPYKSDHYYGFEILFESPVLLKSTTEYRVEALISGPPSSRGEFGYHSVQMSDVKFMFADSGQPAGNATNAAHGQFAEFLYSLH